MLNNKILIIGNSGILLNQRLGTKIDQFDGLVARFNDYVIEGYEQYVGNKTDIWFGSFSFFSAKKYIGPKRIFVGYTSPEIKQLARLKAEFIGGDIIQKARDTINTHTPSGGSLAIMYFLERNYKIFICGFDWYKDPRAHYFGDIATNRKLYVNRNRFHLRRDLEEIWTKNLIKENKIEWFI